MLEIKGFITNLGKYNEGVLVGEWITFPISDEELEEVYNRIGINEEYEEIFFTDWDCSVDFGFGEYPSIDEVNEIAETLEHFSSYDEKVFESALEIFSLKEVMEHDLDEIRLYEDVNTDYDLGYYWVEESGCYDTKQLGNLANYIDYEAFGRDIRLEGNGDFTSNGYLEMI